MVMASVGVQESLLIEVTVYALALSTVEVVVAGIVVRDRCSEGRRDTGGAGGPHSGAAWRDERSRWPLPARPGRGCTSWQD